MPNHADLGRPVVALSKSVDSNRNYALATPNHALGVNYVPVCKHCRYLLCLINE